MPWTRRADRERAARIEAEARANRTVSDWIVVNPMTSAIDHQDKLNNWTLSAKILFSGGRRNP